MLSPGEANSQSVHFHANCPPAGEFNQLELIERTLEPGWELEFSDAPAWSS